VRYVLYLFALPMLVLWLATVVVRFPLILLAMGAMAYGDDYEADRILDWIVWPVGADR